MLYNALVILRMLLLSCFSKMQGWLLFKLSETDIYCYLCIPNV